MRESTTKRPYHSPQRQEQARQTRRQILEAARRLFAERGYAATTLPGIAREAGVSAPTVTAIFGTKRGLLEALIHLIVRGDEEAAPLTARPWWQEMVEEPDPRRQLQLYAAATRRIQARSADLFAIMQGAAAADPEIAALLRQTHEGRYRDVRAISESLAEKGALPPGMTIEEATDLHWTLCSAQVFRLLVVERGWPPDRYERWLASALIHDLLEE